MNAENPEKEKEVIEPAVHGTLNVMRSCVRAGTVKRVVLTSSAAAVTSRPLEGDGRVLVRRRIPQSQKDRWLGLPCVEGALGESGVRVRGGERHQPGHLCPFVTVGAAPAVKADTSVPDVLSLLSGDEARIRRLELIGSVSGSIGMVHVDDLCRAEVLVAENGSS